jgi:hypothetical protein
MLPFIILGAVNAYIFLNTGKKLEIQKESDRLKHIGKKAILFDNLT